MSPVKRSLKFLTIGTPHFSPFGRGCQLADLNERILRESNILRYTRYHGAHHDVSSRPAPPDVKAGGESAQSTPKATATSAKLGLTANLRTKILDFRGFDDSSRILILRGGILMSTGNLPDILSQRILVGIILVERLGVASAAGTPKGPLPSQLFWDMDQDPTQQARASVFPKLTVGLARAFQALGLVSLPPLHDFG